MFEGFEVVEFPPIEGFIPKGRKGFVYVISWERDTLDVPFYVGETGWLLGRMKDYGVRSFAASTDFRVGECIRYLKEMKKYQINVRYKGSSDRKAEREREEGDIIEELHLSGALLLNHFRGYSYRVDDKTKEKKRLQIFCEALIRLKDPGPLHST
jgi:hypothetical protein